MSLAKYIDFIFTGMNDVPDYSNRNLRNATFVGEDLSYTNFSGSDLRGVDFSHANLTAADFTNVRTGIPPLRAILIFILSLLVSLLSGYVAMLAGATLEHMMASPDERIKAAGIATAIVSIVFIGFSYWKGVGFAIRELIIPAAGIAILVGLASYLSGAGTGLGMIYLLLACLLISVMFIVGVIARVVAGSLSNILFLVVAVAGGLFGKSIGGNIGSVVMAISCALISKRALSGATGFAGLMRIALSVTARFGTSFRHSNLRHADFSGSRINNTDFTGANEWLTHWGNTKRVNCIIDEKVNS